MLAKQVVVDGSEISGDRVQAIMNGDRPTDHDLVRLSLVLVKPNGGRWNTDELMEIRDRDFPVSTNQPTEEKNPTRGLS